VAVASIWLEQARIGADITAVNDKLGDLDANLAEWQEITARQATGRARCSTRRCSSGWT
jgi:hypothetical protein